MMVILIRKQNDKMMVRRNSGPVFITGRFRNTENHAESLVEINSNFGSNEIVCM